MGQESLRQKTLFGMIWVGVQRFGTMIISFLSNIVLARLLSPDDYGCIGMLAIFVAISNTFIDGGFGSALIQKSKPTQDDYSTVLYWNLCLSVVLYFVLYACAPFIAKFYGIPLLSDVLRVQGLILIINACSMVQMTQLRKSMAFKRLAVINIVAALISVIIAIIYAWKGGGIWALVVQQLCSSSVTAILLWLFCAWRPVARFSIVSFKELFSFGGFILISNIIISITNNFKGLLIGKAFTATTLGYFAQAQKIENISSASLAGVIEQVSYPLLVEVKNDEVKMRKILKQLNNALLAVIMPIMYLIYLLSVPIIEILFGSKWLPSAPILQVLALQGIFLCIQGTNYNAVAALGHSKMLFRWSIIKSITGIGLMILGLIVGGFTGVLYAMATASALVVLYNVLLVSRIIRYSIWSQFKDWMPIMLLTTVPFIGIRFVLDNWMQFQSAEYGAALLYATLYLMILLLCPMSAITNLRNNIYKVVRRK